MVIIDPPNPNTTSPVLVGIRIQGCMDMLPTLTRAGNTFIGQVHYGSLCGVPPSGNIFFPVGKLAAGGYKVVVHYGSVIPGPPIPDDKGGFTVVDVQAPAPSMLVPGIPTVAPTPILALAILVGVIGFKEMLRRRQSNDL